MTVGFYQIGDTVRAHTESEPFMNSSSVNTDPTVITFAMLEPDGVETTYTGVGANITKSAAGKFSVTWTSAKMGQHQWRFLGTGAAIGAVTGEFMIEGTVLA